jgi:hypothetical protein
MDYSTSTVPTPEKKETSLTDHASNAWSGFTSMFKSSASASASAPTPAPTPSATMGGRRRRHAKSMKGGNPKKGMSSKTRKGKRDFVTHKGDKYYNRKGKRQSKSKSGRKGRPYSRKY